MKSRGAFSSRVELAGAMIVQRLLAGGLMTVLAVPLWAAAPRPRDRIHPHRMPQTAAHSHPGWGTRVFARAEPVRWAETEPSATEQPAEPPPIASQPSPEIAARAQAEFENSRSAKVDRSRYSRDFNARLTDASLAEASAALKALGEVRRFTQVRKLSQGPVTVYVFRIECENPPLVEETIAWDARGKVNVLQYGPVTR